VTALIASSSFSLLAFMGVHAGSGKVFNWFANMTAVAGLLTWFGISVTYIRFYAGMKVQGIDRATLPFASRLQPYAAWYATFGCSLICLVGVSGTFHSQVNIDPNYLTQFSGWSVFLRGNWVTADFITSYLPLAAFPILYLGARFWKRSRPVSASEMDFFTGIAEIEANTYDEPKPKNRVEAVWQWLVSDRVESFCMRQLIAFYHRCDIYAATSCIYSFIPLHYI
jgi:amino acid transporter